VDYRNPEVIVLFLGSFGLITVAFAAVGALERIPALQFRRAGLLRPFLGADIAWFGVAGGASAVSTYVFRPGFSHLTLPGIQRQLDQLDGPARLLLAVAIFDLVAFAVHVTIHRVDVLWNFHKVHHSSLHLDWLATTRTHMFEHLMRNVPAQLTLFVLGFSTRTIALAIAVYALCAVHGHSNLDMNLRFIEPLLITPRLHRSHHVPASTHRNFGTVFSVWDRAAGLLNLGDTEITAQFGVPGERETYPQQFGRAAREPFRQSRQLRGKLTAEINS
jgi:sterol desaturase/sphingolipid hydroxylase (fatty acid hydroxylase superfamily)